MENERWANDWLTGLKKKVRYFRGMIKNTKYEGHVQKLALTRERLTHALNKKYDLASSASALDWATGIMREVEAARSDLDLAIRSSNRKLPHTLEAYRHAVNLEAEIGNGISNFKKTLNERE